MIRVTSLDEKYTCPAILLSRDPKLLLLRISDIVRRKEFSENISMKTTVTLNSQEQQRIKRLNEYMVGLLSVEQVAELMQGSRRQVYRWKASYREKGVEAMAHGNRGKTSPQRIAEPIRAQIMHQACEVYAGCNQYHVRDLLEEREGIVISRRSLRRILEETGKASVKPVSKPKHRLRRPRYRQEGRLVQIDASPHAWLQDCGPSFEPGWWHR